MNLHIHTCRHTHIYLNNFFKPVRNLEHAIAQWKYDFISLMPRLLLKASERGEAGFL